MSIKKLFTGYVIDSQNKTTIYYTDLKDSLPPEIRGFEEVTLTEFGWTGFLSLVMADEKRTGRRYNIQINDLFYETPEEGWL